jgi:hypothetical protein
MDGARPANAGPAQLRAAGADHRCRRRLKRGWRPAPDVQKMSPQTR